MEQLKKRKLKYRLLLVLLVLCFEVHAQRGLGTNSPHHSAILELNSTTKGFLLPRLTQTEIDAIPTPTAGLMVYCTDEKTIFIRDDGAWREYYRRDQIENHHLIAVDANGNVGIGVTPKSWATLNDIKALEVGTNLSLSQDVNSAYVSSNAYNTGNSWKYKNTQFAANYRQGTNDGIHVWYVAPSGAADSVINWTAAMMIDNSGNVGIGTSSLDWNTGWRSLDILDGSLFSQPDAVALSQNMKFNSNWEKVDTNKGASAYQQTGGEHVFYGEPTTNSGSSLIEYMRIDSSGNMGIGTTTTTTTTPLAKLHVKDGPVMTGGWERVLTLEANHPAIQMKGRSQANKSAWIEYDDAIATAGLSFRVGGTSDDISTATRAFKITNSGNVGIGTSTPTSKLQVQGDVKSHDVVLTSDRRWKKDIKPLENSLHKIASLRGVSYQWRQDQFPDKGFSDGTKFGVIAQEIEVVFPELVNEDDQGYKSVAYSNLVAPLIEAVKELKQQNEKQQAVIENLMKRLKMLEAKNKE